MQEHTGKVIHIDRIKKSGYINSEFDNNRYYFKTFSLQSEIEINDRVAFLTEYKNEKQYVHAIRKIYQNSSGLIFIPRVSKTHMHKGVEPHLSHIFEKITDSNEEKIVKDFKFPSIVGKSTCVLTNENDEIFYAIRIGRLGHTRFVLNRQPEDSNFITIVLRKISDYYQILTCYIGRVAKPEPWDEYALTDAFEFWESHALIFGEEDIIIESKTIECPWVLNQSAISRLKQIPNSTNMTP